MSNNLSIIQSLELLATESIGMVTDAVSGTRNVTKTYAAGTKVLLDHTEYYANVHNNHNATKVAELTEATTKLPADVQALLAQFKKDNA